MKEKIFKLEIPHVYNILDNCKDTRLKEIKYSVFQSAKSSSIYLYLYYRDSTFATLRLADHKADNSLIKEGNTFIVSPRTQNKNVLEFILSKIKILKRRRLNFLLKSL